MRRPSRVWSVFASATTAASTSPLRYRTCPSPSRSTVIIPAGTSRSPPDKKFTAPLCRRRAVRTITFRLIGRRRWTALPQEAPCDHHALHLVGALVDLGDLRVAHHPLDGEVLGVARSPEQLHGVGGHLHRDVGGEGLRRGGDAGDVRPSLLPRGRGGVGQKPRRLGPERQGGEDELPALEARDRRPELL